MKTYLNALIYEQISRAESLKQRIEKPLEYPELAGLKERSITILDKQSMILNSCLAELQERINDSDCHDILRKTRGATRQISTIETYGIAALEYQTPESAFLNKLLFKIHQEINFPLPSPVICCISTNYYFTVPFANVIFVPLLETEFLLHLPDLYHEIGHLVARNRENASNIRFIKESFDDAFAKITMYYSDLINEKSREFGPEEIPRTIGYIHEQWKSWIDEFFCDLFGLYTLGPAYAWSHLHLTAKISEDIHQLLIILEQSHPADESRMRILLEGLNLLGFEKDAEQIKAEWEKVKSFWGNPTTEYEYAYPDSLLKEIAQTFLSGIKNSKFKIVDDEFLRQNGSIRTLLNGAWINFWNMPSEEFRNWEKEQIKILKQNILINH